MSYQLSAITSAGGIYVHIPFCARKCSYCDFYSVEDLGLKPAFLAALQAEIASAHAEGLVFDTIYIGGGTPSTLLPAEVGRIIESLAARFRFEGAVEVTLEANPGTVGPDKLKGFRAAGVNRLTIGVQSFDPGRLDLLGRIHTSVQAERAVADARAAGFDEIDIDLIYGLPGQTACAWTDDLERALAHNPEHLSCYMLIIEPGTPMARMRDSGRLKPPPDDQVAELFVLTSELLTGRGYRHYEIANFARCDAGRADAHVSRHNSKYWSYAPYLGFGPAAHSFLPPRRFWNERNLAGYVEAIGAGGAPPRGEEVLTADQQLSEVIMLGLRTAAGLDLVDFAHRFGTEAARACAEAAAPFAEQGLLACDRTRCAPTLRGMLYHNTIVGALTEAVGNEQLIADSS
jgi:oxygen-independent coproporphyrinogen-3 oxidase